MGPLSLLGFALLWTGLVLAELDSTFSHCKKYFYKKIEPQGFDTTKSAKICQRYHGTHYFSTFYDKKSRIPIWSAYTTDEGDCTDTPETWKIEPQLANLKEENMETEGDLTKKEKQVTKEKLKENQAIDDDYKKTHYDRGHLNPNSFQCGQGRTATFTLTNAVPMDPCFNRVTWYELEHNLKMQLQISCLKVKNQKGTAFLVTGAVPSEKYKIPIAKDDEQRNIRRDAERVVVPSHIWTAVCCEHPVNNEKFSFAFLGVNRPDSILEYMTVTDLNERLTGLYGNLAGLPIKIFNDECEENSIKAKKVLLEITKNLRDTFPNWENYPAGSKRPQNNPPIVGPSKRKPNPQQNLK